MIKPLEQRYAIVTGASEGVGQGIARAFAKAGVAGMVLAQRNNEKGQAEAAKLRDAHGIDVVSLQTDVSDRRQVEAMVSFAVERFGRLDILVNNAGASFAKRLELHSDEDMESSFAVNYWSTFWSMRAAFPIMKAQGYGRIINMGSLNGVNAHMFTGAYNASKEAMRALSRTAAVEWAQHGISTNIICPAALSVAAKAYFEANPDMLEGVLASNPARRFGDAELDVAPAAVFLASEQSGFVNGNTVFANGGSHINGIPWRPRVDD